MQDPFPFPSCFSSSNADDLSDAMATKSGQSAVISVYRTKIAGRCRLITVTWCRNLLVHGLSLSLEGSEKLELALRPWNFWRRQGTKRFDVGGKPVDVFWDLRGAKFSGDSPEPELGYYVAVGAEDEIVLLLGDLKKNAFRRSGSRPSAIDATLVSKKEHVFGKKRFATKARFQDKGKAHEISVECSSGAGEVDSKMVIKVDGVETIQVEHLQWKFRGNGVISVEKVKVEVLWDVHDWLFGPGLRHALFIFKPAGVPAPASCSDVEATGEEESSDYSLFLYAWKVE